MLIRLYSLCKGIAHFGFGLTSKTNKQIARTVGKLTVNVCLFGCRSDEISRQGKMLKFDGIPFHVRKHILPVVLRDLFRGEANLVLLMSRGHRYGSTVELHVGDLGIGPGKDVCRKSTYAQIDGAVGDHKITAVQK